MKKECALSGKDKEIAAVLHFHVPAADSVSHLCLFTTLGDLVEEGDLALEAAVEVGFLVSCAPRGPSRARYDPGKSKGLQGWAPWRMHFPRSPRFVCVIIGSRCPV